MRLGRGAIGALALLTAIIAAAQIVFYFPRTVDDLFISLRYADHFTHGLGLVYNPGQRVEGFSSPLWLLLQSLGMLLGIEGVVATKLLSLLSLGFLFWLSWSYARRLLQVGPVLSVLLLAALAADSYVMSWGLLGLETPLYLALLLAWPLALARHLARGTRRTAGLCVLSGLALALARPEAPMYVALLGAAQVLEPRPGRALRRRVRRALAPALVLIGLALLLLALRHAYYGLWLPHTYYAKRGHGFELAKLSQLFGNGASVYEIAFLSAGLLSALWLAVWRRHAAPLVGMLSCLLFVCVVLPDWMPNQRHALPVWLFGLLSLGAAAAALLRRAPRQRWLYVPGAAALALIAMTAVYQAQIDSRYSFREHQSHEGHWLQPKTADAFRDSWLSLRHIPPPEVASMRIGEMGMIEQLFRVLDASRKPESESWYVGRDIGRVGYYSPVRIFDEDGLFTPAVTESGPWRESGDVTARLFRRAFAHHPVAAELFDAWPFAAARLRSELERDYRPIDRGWNFPVGLERNTSQPPSPRQALRRYERVADRFPHSFYLATLYGESVGGAVARRVAYMRRILSAGGSFERDSAPPGLTAAGVSFGQDAIKLLGCELSKSVVHPGSDVLLRCYFSATRPVKRRLRVFVHLLDPDGHYVLSADHAPCAGLFGVPQWKPGHIVLDVAPVTIPASFAPTTLRLRIGLFDDLGRMPAQPKSLVDKENRALGPTLRVVQ